MKLKLDFTKNIKLGFTGDELKIRDILENHSEKIPAKNEKYNLADLYTEKSLTDLLNPEPKKVTKRKISDFETALKILYSVAGKSKLEIESVSRQYKQVLTHQVILGQFIKAKTNQPLKIKGFELAGKKELAGLPFPKFINQYLQDKTVPLNLL